MKKICVGLAVLGCIICLLSFVKNNSNQPAQDGEVIAMRRIGHALLLQAGDSTSNLLPVKQMGRGIYQLQFRQPITFVPDSLVNIVERVTTSAGLPQQYLVKMVNDKTNDIIYSYEVLNKVNREDISCLGRQQPIANYTVNISFNHKAPNGFIASGFVLPSAGILVSLFSLAVLFLYSKKLAAPTGAVPYVAIGRFCFYIESGILKYNGNPISLTAKEIKLLSLFAKQPNTVIAREQLVSHLWGEEGTLVGSRSLDVFVSKLRKKLESDETVNIVNAHGLGYKLEIGTN